jgi:hypothetical protein
MEITKQEIEWISKLDFTIKYMDPKIKLWLLKANRQAVKGKLNYFQRNFIIPDPYDPELFGFIKKEMIKSIKKIKSLTRQIRKVKAKGGLK